MLFQQLINGLSVGGIYALMAVGYSLIYSLLNFTNFAHSITVTIGAFATFYFLTGVFENLYVGIIVAILAAGVLAMLIEILGYTKEDITDSNISDIKDRLSKQDINKLSEDLGIGVPTIRDIVDSLLKKGRDPRDELPKPVLLTDVMDINDLKPDMIMTGTVRNVIDFGAFIDIGVHQDGLVHISQISDRYIKHPTDVLSVGDIVKVRILEVDPAKKRIALTMKGVK